jgi:hypothetical protein
MRAGLADFRHRKPISAGEQANANAYQKLLRQHVVPWAQRMHYDEKYTSFSGFGTGPHCQDRQTVVGGILDFGSLATIFTRHEPAGHLYLARFAGESPRGDLG